MDNCNAIDCVLHKGKPMNVYNIGGGEEVTNIELTKMILRLLGKPESLIQRVADRLGHDRRYSLDTRKIRKELSFQPQYKFLPALEETVHWYHENQKWWKKIKKKSRDFKKFYKQNYKRKTK